MMALDLPDGTFAGITAFYTIVTIPHGSLPVVSREMERVLEPDGLLLFAFHTGDEVLYEDELWAGLFHGFLPLSTIGNPTVCHPHSFR